MGTGPADPGAHGQKLLFISQWYAPEAGDGGIPRGIATALSGPGRNVEVLTGFPNYPLGRLYDGYQLRPYQRETWDGLIVHRSPLYISHDSNGLRRAANYGSFAAASSAIALARVPRVDVSLVYSSPITAAAAALTIRRVRRTPFILLIQDMWPQSVTASGMMSAERMRRVEPALQRFCDYVYRAASAIVVTSPGMINLVAERGVPLDKIQYIPNWADEERYFRAERREELRRELGLTRRFTVMYAGNLGEVQGLDVLLAAAARLRNARDVGFALVGGGAAEQSLREVVRRDQLHNVVFVPPQPPARMADVLASADVQLVSLKDELIFRSTMPSKVQSLLAAGQPIIAAVAGDAARTVEQSGAGVVVEPGNASQLAGRIQALSELSSEQLADMGDAGLNYYRATFARARAVDAFDTLLTRVAESARGQMRR